MACPLVKGKKNDSILYLRAKQGFGKSTLQNFIRKHLIGSDLSLEEGSNPLISDFNERLAGKYLLPLKNLNLFQSPNGCLFLPASRDTPHLMS